MIAKFFSLSSSELFLRGSKFLFFLAIANFYSQTVIYEYGLFTALFSIVFVFSDFGYQAYILKSLSSSKSYTLYIKYSQLAIFRVSLFFIISISILIYYMHSTNTIYAYIFILFLADAIFAINFSFYRAYENSKRETIVKFSIGLIFILISILVFLKVDSKIAFLILSSSYLIYAIYNAKFMRLKTVFLFIKNFRIKEYLTISQNSFFIFIGSLFTIAYLRIDILMLDWFNLTHSVSLYTIASRVLELTLIVPSMISVLLFPKLVKNKNINIKKDISIQFLIGVGVMLLFLSISSLVINRLFINYQNSIEVLNILLFSIPFMLVNGYIFTLFIAKDISRYYALITFFMFIANTILNYFYIPLYGYTMAAYTTLLTEFFGTFFAILSLFKGKPLFFKKIL